MSLARLPMCAERINDNYNDYTLLDAGCRTMELKPLLKGCREYYGSDLFPAEGVLECDLEKPLPFEDNSFDVVTALDVLEHLNNPHATLKELYRVARKAVFISLPNMYYISFRLNYLRGNLSGKYHFSPEPILDRHRWVMSYTEALEFIRWNSKSHKIAHNKIIPIRNRTRYVSKPIEHTLAAFWPNLFAYGVLFEIILDKNSEQ